MTYIENLWLFFIMVTGIIIVPGMDMMFVLANTLAGGRRAGAAATLGVMAGAAVHTIFGAFMVAGLSTLIPSISGVMLAAGSAYMMWIGFTLARSAIVMGPVETISARASHKVFAQALITNLLNPKAWLFMLAVFPQFMKPAYGPFAPQALALGLIAMTMQCVVYGALAWMASRGREAFISNPTLTIWIGRGAGIMLVAIAALTLAQGWKGL